MKNGQTIDKFSEVTKAIYKVRADLNNGSFGIMAPHGTYINFNSMDQNTKEKYAERVFFDLLNELTSHVDMSLQAINQERLSVAYSLIRKPYRDITAIFEFLYVDRHKFIDGLIDPNYGEKIDVSKYKIYGRYLHPEIKKALLKKDELSEEFIESVYKFRYSINDNEHDFSKYMTQSLHIVTDRKHIESGPGRLNMLQFTNVPTDSLTEVFFICSKIIYFYSAYLIDVLLVDVFEYKNLSNLENLRKAYYEII